MSVSRWAYCGYCLYCRDRPDAGFMCNLGVLVRLAVGEQGGSKMFLIVCGDV